jgi:YihY family inner membrane protein
MKGVARAPPRGYFMAGVLKHATRSWGVVRLAAQTFVRIDGTQWAGSFAFNAFLSLFPVAILFVTLASLFVDRQTAGQAIVTFMEGYVPIDGEMRARVFGALASVIEARQQASVVALLSLLWAALQWFNTLVLATNRAWGDRAYSWWRLPLRALALLAVTAGAVLLGMAAPVLASVGKSWLFPAENMGATLYALWGALVPLLLLFLSLTFFFRLAPRKTKRFSEVWVAAACTTLLLQATERLFVLYLDHSAGLSAVYGVFGGITAFLLWIYLSGCGFIFGACLCSAQAERTEAVSHSSSS